MLDATLAYDAWVAHNPKSNVMGFYIWAAYSRLTSWMRIAEEYFKALGDTEKERTFENDTAGLPWEQKGESPPWETLRDRARPSKGESGYASGTIPAHALLVTIGIDVQGD